MTTDSTTKRCAKCGGTFPATSEFFHKDKSTPDGFTYFCKPCRYTPKPVHQPQEGYKFCPKCEQEKPSTNDHFYTDTRTPDGFRLPCKSCAIIAHAEYRKNNREKVIESARLYRLANKKQLAEKNREYSKKNPQGVKERSTRWRKRNPEHFRVASANRRALRKQLPNTFTTKQWITCLEYHHYCCAVCGVQLRDLFGDVVPHADHWIPLSNLECPGTTPDNMICLCNSCNSSKQDTPPDEWLKSKFGTRKANEILARVTAYFEWVINS